jgi:tRNA (cytosine38-C5)-methyltransferase
MRVLELFSGIGGLAAALDGRAEIVGAVDHDRRAAGVYAAHFPHPVHIKNLVSVKLEWLEAFEADLWWMSPPCAPHGIRGAQEDLDDPRSEAFRRVVAAIAALRPRYVALENVPWFAGSRAFALLTTTLDEAGYSWQATELCPSALGVPAARRRCYLVAGRAPLDPIPAAVFEPWPLAQALGPWRDELQLPASLLERFGAALHVVDADDPQATAACFTRAYGRSPVYCGSYLRQDGRLRHFAPEEIARLYGFPEGFGFPGLSPAEGWKLVGNGVAVQAVRHVLGGVC